MDLNPQQFPLFPTPKFPGNARGFVGPERPPAEKPETYIRFGDWPENERSTNWVTGGTEEGVSVYDMHKTFAKPLDPDPSGERYERAKNDEWGQDFADDYGNDTGAEMEGRMHRALRDARNDHTWDDHEEQNPGRRGHFVRGTLTSFGHDDEPLLENVRSVGAWPQDAHRFAPGEDGELVRKTNKYGWIRGF